LKIRKGFISNSSSTSFICEVCGECVSGMDMSLDEAEMYVCENGHTFCQSEVIGNSIIGEDGEDILSEKSLVMDDDDEYVAAKHCPCCTFNHVSSYDLTDYLLKKANMSREDVANELKGRFKEFAKFREYIREH